MITALIKHLPAGSATEIARLPGKEATELPSVLPRSFGRGWELTPRISALCAMPLYFFHICNGSGFTEDEEGCTLADNDDARRVAILSARDVMSNDVRDGQLDLASFIEVEDEQRKLLFTLTFAEAVNIKSERQPSKAQIAARRVEE